MSEKLYYRIINNQTTAVILADASLQVEFMNSAAETLVATSSGRSHGHPVSELFELTTQAIEEFKQALETGQPYTKRKSTLAPHNGCPVTVDYTVTPISGDDGPDYLVIEIFPRDRWLRISREESLMEQQEASRTLIRGFAHEVKNPLGGIRGAAQLLQRELSDPRFDEYTHVIIEEADRLRNLVNQMLGPYKPTDFSSVNIHEALERVRSLVESESGGEIRILRDYDPSIPELMGNKELLIQALLNITRNAMYALQQHPGETKPEIKLVTRTLRQLTLGAHRYRIVCRVDIIDNGPGIPENIQDTIFYPMVSGSASGTGLGLTIAQRIIHQHQGLVEYESSPGNTCFTLYIPIRNGEK